MVSGLIKAPSLKAAAVAVHTALIQLLLLVIVNMSKCKIINILIPKLPDIHYLGLVPAHTHRLLSVHRNNVKSRRTEYQAISHTIVILRIKLYSGYCNILIALGIVGYEAVLEQEQVIRYAVKTG